jgi:hypothetical protein
MIQGMNGGTAEGDSQVIWTMPALERLEKIPEFVRPMARAGIERYAKEQGVAQIDESVLDKAKDFFGM